MNFVVHNVSTGGVIGEYTMCGDSAYPNCSDPSIEYDRIDGVDRWVLSYVAYQTTSGPSEIIIGVSQDTSILDGFATYAFPQPYLQDYPHFGVSLDQLVLNVNIFNSSGSGGDGFYVFDTQACNSSTCVPDGILAGNPTYTYFVYSNEFALIPQTETGYARMQLVEGPNSSTLSDGFNVWEVGGTNANNNIVIGLEGYTDPELTQATEPGYNPGGSFEIDTNDTRAYTPVETFTSNGPVLWWTDNNICNVGDGGINGSGYESCADVIALYEDPNSGYTNNIANQFTIAGYDTSFYYAALGSPVNGNNVVGIVDWSNSSSYAPSVATFELNLTSGLTNIQYTAIAPPPDNAPYNRWGDYSGCEYTPYTPSITDVCASDVWGYNNGTPAEDVASFVLTA